MEPVQFRYAALDDAVVLSGMNRQLIVEEKHRNAMTTDELIERMRGFLSGEYKALVFESGGKIVGHALYRKDPEWFYVRQFFVIPSHRRRGIGTAAIHWLFKNAWQGGIRVRLDVLAWNPAGIAFWKSLGFGDYALTMEKEV
jgi:GNAT superfamily N-acetyltransferase